VGKRIFHMQGSTPPASGKSYAGHVSVRIVASDIKKAIALVEEKYPGITIHNVQHHGIVDIEEA
jgi:hypothetical protein